MWESEREKDLKNFKTERNLLETGMFTENNRVFWDKISKFRDLPVRIQ